MDSITRRSLLVGSASALAGVALHGQPSDRKPNILFICSDQHTGPAVGASGHPIVKTPNLDRLAARGVNFRHAYSGNPVCVPGRASLMTGMWASDVGSYCNSTPFDGRVPTWGNRMRDAGYHTWATGKMDLWHDKDLGFHEVHTSHGHSEDPDITSLFRAPVCFRPKERNNADGEYADRRAPDLPRAEGAINFLKDEAPKLGRPWCAYVGFSKPHPKFDAALKYREIYPPEKMPLPRWPEGYLERRHTMFQVLANFKNVSVPVPEERVRRARSCYFGLITELDELIGRVLDQLERSGQMENTLVVYTSDHGEMLGEHGLWLKNVLLEGAARVPLVMAGAGLPAGKTVTTAVSHADIAATLLDLAGAPRPEELRGHSLVPLARGEAGTHPGFAFSESHSEGNCTGSFMIRKGDLKYLYFTGDEPLLFDLKKDPGEFQNLAGKKEFAGVLKEMHAHLASLLDPDAVTQAAFRKQAEVLARLVREQSKKQFYKTLVGRLGPAQARVLTDKHYT
jgi:choline-sulfatase